MEKKNLSKEELKEIAKAIKPLLKSGASMSEMAEKLANIGFSRFSEVKNPVGKMRDTLKSKGFKEALMEISDDDDACVEVEEGLEDLQYQVLKDGTIKREVNLITPEGNIDVSSEAAIMQALGYDPKAFKLVSANVRRGSWNMLSKAAGGDAVDLYSFKITASVKPLDPSKGEVSTELVKEIVADLAKRKEKPIVYDRKFEKDVERKIAIVNVADLHLGKLAWAPECGESYDHRIAIKRFNTIIHESIRRLENEKNVEKIIFYWSQDFFHFDGLNQTTTAGTFQQTDLRWQKMFATGCELLVKAIESLKAVADVETFYVRSNHDEQAGFYATNVLAARFSNDRQVTIDLSPSPRKYIEFGINLLGFAHGDKEGKRITHAMPVEAPEAWGRTKNREFFLGHFHSLRTYEEGGVIFRHMSAPCGPDAWHAQSGFVGALKAAQMFIRGEFSGQLAEYNIPLWK